MEKALKILPPTPGFLDRVNSLVEVKLTPRDLGLILARMGNPRMWDGLAEAVAIRWNHELMAQMEGEVWK
jgi:hypothetical protein